MEMTKTIDFDRLAIREIRDARRWYARKRADLEIRFISAFQASSRRAAQTPQACSPHLYGTRVVQLRKFPYWIVFVEEPQRILILGVMHSHRKPGYWRKRLPKP